MTDLVGKKILFICPRFFGYEREIESELLKLGAIVDFFDDRPFTASIYKIFNRINFKFFIRRRIRKYYDSILVKSDAEKYDLLFLVNPETVPFYFIKSIKNSCPGIRTVLYMWDSIKNRKNTTKLIEHCDKVASFDKEDAVNNRKVDFLPLFFTPNYDVRNYNCKESIAACYNAAFIGTAHSDRYAFVNKITAEFPSTQRNNFLFFYCPSRLLFFMKKFFSSEMKGLSFNQISFDSISSKQISDILMRSAFVIDLEHPKQNGLTMRTIEMMGLQKKLITANKNVVDYDFYNPNNICVVDRVNPKMDMQFLLSEFESIDPVVLNKYTLNSWLKNLL